MSEDDLRRLLACPRMGVGLMAFVALMFLLLLASEADATPEVEWDPELTDLNISWTPAADCSTGCWRLWAANALDPDEGGGNHHVYVRLLQDGSLAGNLPFHVAWEGGNDRALTKTPPEWADIPLWSCYSPEEGPGPYRAYAGDVEANSDVVHGLGLPICFHYSYQLEWEWVEAECVGCVPVAWLPLVAR